jgi:hypothetical protein
MSVRNFITRGFFCGGRTIRLKASRDPDGRWRVTRRDLEEFLDAVAIGSRPRA